MKATVRFDDIFEGEDLPDIYRQVLDYLQNVVDQQDLDPFDITLDEKGYYFRGKFHSDIRLDEWKSSVLNE